MTEEPKNKAEAVDFIRTFLIENLPRTFFEQAYLDKAGKSQQEIDAELLAECREMVRLMKEQRGEAGWPSDAVCNVLPYVFLDLVRERVKEMQTGTA